MTRAKTKLSEEKILTKAEVLARTKGLPKDRARSVVCALLGHSRVQSTCFGYYNCCRCDAQIGDSLASIYPEAAQAVVLDHNCTTCRKNAKMLTWRDLLLLPSAVTKYVRKLGVSRG